MNRKELIHHLCEKAENKAIRGNSIWCVINKKIRFYNLYQQNQERDEWREEKEEEEEGFSKNNCPKLFLEKTKTIDKEWRKKVVDFFKNNMEIKEKMKKEFKECNENERIKVYLERKGYVVDPNVFILEEIAARMIGRANNGCLYHIVPRLVKKIKKISLDKKRKNM